MKSLNAKHILVKHQYEAEDLLRHLEKGESFENLAQKYSLCSSAKAGGDLGNLSGKKNLDDNFLEALQLLKVGQISKAVRSRFGYHLIMRY